METKGSVKFPQPTGFLSCSGPFFLGDQGGVDLSIWIMNWHCPPPWESESRCSDFIWICRCRQPDSSSICIRPSIYGRIVRMMVALFGGPFSIGEGYGKQVIFDLQFPR